MDEIDSGCSGVSKVLMQDNNFVGQLGTGVVNYPRTRVTVGVSTHYKVCSNSLVSTDRVVLMEQHSVEVISLNTI